LIKVIENSQQYKQCKFKEEIFKILCHKNLSDQLSSVFLDTKFKYKPLETYEAKFFQTIFNPKR
jgi:hypothetical protein